MTDKIGDASKIDVAMKNHLHIDEEKANKVLEIKMKIFNKELTPQEARELVNKTFDYITAEEFAFGEQHLFETGITDEIMVEGMDDVIEVFQDVLQKKDLNLPLGHPIRAYQDESNEIEKLIFKIESKLKGKFIVNEWLEIYEQLDQLNIHFSRKQNQLYSALEHVGFDRPSKIMWTFDDRVRDAIKEAYQHLEAKNEKEFIELQENIIVIIKDILSKERDILYPTSLEILTDEIFVEMQKGDAEIGYCLIDIPPKYVGKNSNSPSKIANEDALVADLKKVLEKHGISAPNSNDSVLDVATGKLTLEQINLIYKHIRMDLSFVDETDTVKFYTDTDHRVFPRSAGVIGRKVENCHPRESLDTVLGVVEAFKSGEQDEAEFWIESRGKFIHILFVAVRDEQGKYRGVLEMMQDVTHIRSLEGSRRLLSWKNTNKDHLPIEKKEINLDPSMKIGDLLASYPFVKDYLISLHPEYKRLNNPVLYAVMKKTANLNMVAEVGKFEIDEFLEMLKKEIEAKTK